MICFSFPINSDRFSYLTPLFLSTRVRLSPLVNIILENVILLLLNSMARFRIIKSYFSNKKKYINRGLVSIFLSSKAFFESKVQLGIIIFLYFIMISTSLWSCYLNQKKKMYPMIFKSWKKKNNWILSLSREFMQISPLENLWIPDFYKNQEVPKQVGYIVFLKINIRDNMASHLFCSLVSLHKKTYKWIKPVGAT